MPGITCDVEPTASIFSREEDSERGERMNSVQEEALGNSRRNNITTAEFRENRSYVPVYLLENLRLVNQAGTAENRVSHDKKKRLKAWNNVHVHLKEDVTLQEDFGDVNEGLGQTHRAKLMEDPSVRDYDGDFDPHRGGHRQARGGHGRRGTGGRHSGGRCGGSIGRSSGSRVGRQAPGEHRVGLTNASPSMGTPGRHVVTRQRTTRSSALTNPPENPAPTRRNRGSNTQVRDSRENRPRTEPYRPAEVVAASVARQEHALRTPSVLASPAAFMAAAAPRPSRPADATKTEEIKLKAVSPTPAATKNAKERLAAASEISSSLESHLKSIGIHASGRISEFSINAPTITQPNRKPLVKQNSTPEPAQISAKVSEKQRPSNEGDNAKAKAVAERKSSVESSTPAATSTRENAAASEKSAPATNLIDLDDGNQTGEQPVLGFTHQSVEAAPPTASTNPNIYAQMTQFMLTFEATLPVEVMGHLRNFLAQMQTGTTATQLVVPTHTATGSNQASREQVDAQILALQPRVSGPLLSIEAEESTPENIVSQESIAAQESTAARETTAAHEATAARQLTALRAVAPINAPMPTIFAAPSSMGPREERRGMAQVLQASRHSIIGEHVYRPGFQSAVELALHFERLSIRDGNESRPAATATTSERGMSSVHTAQQIQSQASGKGSAVNLSVSRSAPTSSTAMRASSLTTSTNRAAPSTQPTTPAIQAPQLSQSTISNENTPPFIQPRPPPSSLRGATNPFGSERATRNRFGSGSRHAPPTLPAHLRNMAPTTDHGAATRAQYQPSGTSSIVTTRNELTASHDDHRTATGAHYNAAQPIDNGAAIRAEHQRATASIDHGATTRAQYQSPTIANIVSSRNEPAVSLGDHGAVARAQHQRSASIADHGAPPRAQCMPLGTAINGTNRNMPASTAPASFNDPSCTTPVSSSSAAVRGNMINQTGFMRIAEDAARARAAAAAAARQGQDHAASMRNRGL